MISSKTQGFPAPYGVQHTKSKMSDD